MKKIKDRFAAVERTRRAERRAARRLKVLRSRRRAHQLPVTYEGDGHVVIAPFEFALETHAHHDSVALFLRRLRSEASTCAASRRALVVDFRETRKMIAGATLLFFSELHRLQAIFPQMVMRCIPPKDRTVAEVLQHLGIFEMLGHESAVIPTRPDVVSWRKASSASVDGVKVGTLIETYKSLDSELAKHLFRGVSEAMGNAVNHAYIEPRNDGLPAAPEERWWMFCRQDADRLVVAVCDLGIGIPRSLPLMYAGEAFVKALDVGTRGWVRSDSWLIEAAMTIERTRTQRRGRGKGLGDTRRLVDAVPGGTLIILSNRGQLQYSGNGLYKRKNYEHSIKGTVVLWSIPLNGGSHG